MTTEVRVQSPRPNHEGVHVETMRPVRNEDGTVTLHPHAGASFDLSDGQRTPRHGLFVHGSSALLVTELPKSQFPQTDTREYTLAEKMAGVPFNPGNNHDVANCRTEFADCIARMLELSGHCRCSEVQRMAEIALQHIQTAQMWAVSAITWRD